MSTLYHISGWNTLSSITEGEFFILNPGSQNAEGIGVYFSEGSPRLSAAEGACGRPSAVVVLEVSESVGWWQSKSAKAKKFGKPRTWHSDGKSIECYVQEISEINLTCGVVRMLRCSFRFHQH